MTRVLAELLGAREPAFHQALRRLEQASGHASADIRLSGEVERATRLKLKELGLDPKDTTGAELYHALGQKIVADSEALTKQLHARYGADQPNVQIGKAILDLPVTRDYFALKTSVAKKLLHKHVPKQTLKSLGYRSFDSLVRRESLLATCAAAWLVESNSWRKSMLDEYKQLTPADFEIRRLTVLTPDSVRWQKLAEGIVTQKKHNVIVLKEYAALVILPFPKQLPPAALMTALVIALQGVNELRSSSTYLKLSQVRSDFGKCVQAVVMGEPVLPANLLEGQVSWHVIQRYYARFIDRFREELFEPHVQREDLVWHSVEKALSYIEPNVTFWHNTAMLGLLDGPDPVSLNVIDAALNFCNQLPYEQRTKGHLRRNLWNELAIRYLKHDNVEQAVMGSLATMLAPVEQPAEAEFDTV